MKLRLNVLLCVAMLLALCSPAHSFAQKTSFKNNRDAYNVGVAMYNAKEFAESEEAFEAAIKLAGDAAAKIRGYRALMAVYRNMPGNDKMFVAAEFVIGKSENDATQSLARRALLSFVQQRGLVDKAVARYEMALKTDSPNRTALYVLSEIYNRMRRDPKRRLELLEQLIALQEKDGADKPINVLRTASQAKSYIDVKKYAAGAQLYEKIAPLKEELAAWHWKEAAAAWLKANEKEKALTAAMKSLESPPEKRSPLLTYFWRQALADVFLQLDKPKLAIPNYEQALANTSIEGYKKTSLKKLAEARERAKGR